MRLVRLQLRVRGLQGDGVVARYTVGWKCGWRRENCLNLQEVATWKWVHFWITPKLQLNCEHTCDPINGPWISANLLISQRISSSPLLWTNICAKLFVMRCLRGWNNIWSMNCFHEFIWRLKGEFHSVQLVGGCIRKDSGIFHMWKGYIIMAIIIPMLLNISRSTSCPWWRNTKNNWWNMLWGMWTRRSWWNLKTTLNIN